MSRILQHPTPAPRPMPKLQRHGDRLASSADLTTGSQWRPNPTELGPSTPLTAAPWRNQRSAALYEDPVYAAYLAAGKDQRYFQQHHVVIGLETGWLALLTVASLDAIFAASPS